MKFIFPLIFLLSINIFCCKEEQITLKELITSQKNKYPAMRLQDIYKLLYQSVFGVKHLLKDTLMSKKYLIEEYDSINPVDTNLMETISTNNEIVRIDLKAFKYRDLSIEKLFTAMQISAKEINGNPEIFKKYWNEFKDLVIRKELIFNLDDFRIYEEKPGQIPPEVHHSEIYIEKYNPHYRVVKRDVFKKYFPEIKD